MIKVVKIKICLEYTLELHIKKSGRIIFYLKPF